MGRLLAVVALSVAVLAQGAEAGERWRGPRTAAGHPDLQGLWTFNSMSRLERHDVFPSVVITEEQARNIRPPPLIAPDSVGQDHTETFDAEGLALARVGDEIRTAWIVDPADGRLPYTPEGRARRARDAPNFDGPERRPNQERCLILPGPGPPMLNSLYNNNVEIVQTPDHVVLHMESNHEARIVPIGRRPHTPIRRWMGDTVGWWEGDTLVMETTHFTPSQSWRSYPLAQLYLSPDAVVTERLRRVSLRQILYSYTVVDPANYTQPWRGEMPLTATKGPMFEYACHEGNYSIRNILAGARSQEREAAVKPPSAP
jgi:hypothetical protein